VTTPDLTTPVTVSTVAAIRWATGMDISIVWMLSIIGALLLVPLFIASTLDKRMGATLARD
jgi:hypothetical protein